MTLRASSLLAALLPVLLLTACKSAQETMMENAIENSAGDDADVDVRADGTMKIETDEGRYETGGSMPADWPADVAVYEGAQVQFSGSANAQTGKPGLSVILMTQDDIKTVAAFYEQSLKDNGWTVDATMQAAGSTILSASKDGRTLGMSISGTETSTMIVIGIEKEAD